MLAAPSAPAPTSENTTGPRQQAEEATAATTDPMTAFITQSPWPCDGRDSCHRSDPERAQPAGVDGSWLATVGESSVDDDGRNMRHPILLRPPLSDWIHP